MAVVIAAFRPEQFWVAGSSAKLLHTLQAVWAPTWAAS